MRRIEARRCRAVLMWIVGVYSVFIVIAYAVHLAGARFNFTASLPQGLYWTVDKAPEKGDIVTFAPPSTPLFQEAVQRHYIHRSATGIGPGLLLKQVAAASGDTITVCATGVIVNGRLLQNSAPLSHDGAGRELQPSFADDYTLAADEVFLFSEHNPDSFDSRYFGVQKREHIKNVVRPVLIYVPPTK